MVQRHPTSSATRSAILNASEMSAWPSPLPENRLLQQALRAGSEAARTEAGRARTWWGRPRAERCRRQRKVSNHAAGSRFIDRYIRHTDRALLLILPGVALQIIVEPMITAIEMPGLVVLFKTTDKNGHSASEGSTERIRGAGWFPRDTSSARLSSSRGVQAISTRGR